MIPCELCCIFSENVSPNAKASTRIPPRPEVILQPNLQHVSGRTSSLPFYLLCVRHVKDFYVRHGESELTTLVPDPPTSADYSLTEQSII